MKIIYLFRSVALLAGMERILTDKMNYLADQLGYDVYLVTYEQGDNPLSFFLSSRIKHIDLGVLFYLTSRHSIIVRSWKYLMLRKKFKKSFYEVVSNINPDIIVTTNYSYHQLDIIANVPGNCKRILETHIAKEAMQKSADFKKSSLLKKIAQFYDNYVTQNIKRFDALVTLTKQDKKKWENIVPTVVIPNILTIYPKEHATLKNKKIISVGRLESQKGYDLLIQAWGIVTRQHLDWEMHIFGHGSCKVMLQNLITESQLESSFFLHDATPNIYEEYFKHSIYVMSSRFEGFGLVLIEAMSCGLPCISFDCPSGPSEVIKDEEDGILVENGSTEGLAKAICYLIEKEDKRKQMGLKARENVLRYSKANIMPQWDTLFRELS